MKDSGEVKIPCNCIGNVVFWIEVCKDKWIMGCILYMVSAYVIIWRYVCVVRRHMD